MSASEQKQNKGALEHSPLLVFIWAVLPIVTIFGISMASQSPNPKELFEGSSIISLSFMQIASVGIMLVLPALLIAYLYKKRVFQFLGMTKKPSFELLFLSLGIIFSANFFMNYLVDLNALIPLNDSLAAKFNSLHDSAIATQNYFLGFNGGLEFLMVFITMAVVPALAEEMYFRGLIEGILIDLKVGGFHAILVSSLLFAMMHFQFFYLLPLLFMGAILGYIYYRTKNLWLTMAMHFMNNAIIVIVAWSNSSKITTLDLEANPPIFVSLVGLFIFIYLLYIFHGKTLKTT